MIVWRDGRESWRSRSDSRESEEPAGSASAQNSWRHIISHINSHASTWNVCPSLVAAHTHAMLAFHCPRQHPRDACLSLATAHTHSMLTFHWPQPTPARCLPFTGFTLHPYNTSFRNHFVDLISSRMLYQHPQGSSQVKVTYYKLLLFNAGSPLFIF